MNLYLNVLYNKQELLFNEQNEVCLIVIFLERQRMNMTEFSHIIEQVSSINCCKLHCDKTIGEVYNFDTEELTGYYWCYQGDGFIVDIHDHFTKIDYVSNINMGLYEDDCYIASSYIVSASGEWLNPYQTMESNSVFVRTSEEQGRYFVHAHSRFSTIGVKFSKEYINKHVLTPLKWSSQTMAKIFYETEKCLVAPMSKLADEIMQCHMSSVSARLFFEAKAKEWLSLTLEAYFTKEVTISQEDARLIEDVAAYIDDHYALELPQEVLEEISMMSGTKLKRTFTAHFGMSITEYTQRKRMNFAENLLLRTDMAIKDIARSVGYNSPSRFSTLFYRYKNIYPKDVRQFTNISPVFTSPCQHCALGTKGVCKKMSESLS